MNLSDVSNLRLVSQQIQRTNFNHVKDLLGWMGALQAQEFNMAKWAVGIRLPNTTDNMVEEAMNHAEIIRTHLLRPTWHLVSAEDIHWILDLTAPKLKASARSRNRQLGLTDEVLCKSTGIIEKALCDKKTLTRDEILPKLENAKIAVNENRAAHILFWAELEGVICSGPIKGRKQTYTLLEEWVPKTKSLTREESLAKLASIYFASRCPASTQDFAWWSGLSMTEAKQAIGTARPTLGSITVEERSYWIHESSRLSEPNLSETYLLPAYDEFLISYADRSAALHFQNNDMTVSSNGIFRPIIVAEGQVIGIWKRIENKDKLIIQIEPFKETDQAGKAMIEKAARRLAFFWDKEIEVIHKCRD